MHAIYLFSIVWFFIINLFLIFFLLIKAFDFSEHSINFEKGYLLKCWFHRFRFFSNIQSYIPWLLFYWDTVQIQNYLMLIYPIFTHVYLRIVNIYMFCISCLAFVRFMFHWYLHCSILNIRDMQTVLTNQITDILNFNDKTQHIVPRVSISLAYQGFTSTFR